MNRDIKFKVWNSKHGWWASVMELLEVVPISGFIKAKTIQMGTNDEDGKEWVFNQYIGFKDKNGNEIYEGDIIKRFTEVNPDFGYDLCVVKWNSSRCYFELDRANDKSSYWGAIHSDTRNRYEVVGNIYENPDLLK